MKNKIIIGLLVSLACNSLQAQDKKADGKKVKKVKITDLYLMLNNKVSNNLDGSLADFKKPCTTVATFTTKLFWF